MRRFVSKRIAFFSNVNCLSNFRESANSESERADGASQHGARLCHEGHPHKMHFARTLRILSFGCRPKIFSARSIEQAA